MSAFSSKLKYVDQQTRDIVNNFIRNAETILIRKKREYYIIHSYIKIIVFSYIGDHFLIDRGTIEWKLNNSDIQKLLNIFSMKTHNNNNILIASQTFTIASLKWHIQLLNKNNNITLSLTSVSKLNDIWKGIEFLCIFQCPQINWKDTQIIWTEQLSLQYESIIPYTFTNIKQLTFIATIKILQIRYKYTNSSTVYYRCKDYFKINKLKTTNTDNSDVFQTWNNNKFIQNMSYENIIDKKLDEYDHKFREIDRKLSNLTRNKRIQIEIDECKYNNEEQSLLSEDKLFKFLVDDVQLSEYYDLFIKNGYDNIFYLYDITRNDLKDIGITKIGHQNRIIHYIELMKERDNIIKHKKDKSYLLLVLFVIGYIIPIIIYILSLIFKQIYIGIFAMILLFIVSIIMLNRVDDQCILPWIASPFGENKDKAINLIYLHLVFTILCIGCCAVYINDYSNYVALIFGLLSYASGLICGVLAVYEKTKIVIIK